MSFSVICRSRQPQNLDLEAPSVCLIQGNTKNLLYKQESPQIYALFVIYPYEYKCKNCEKRGTRKVEECTFDNEKVLLRENARGVLPALFPAQVLALVWGWGYPVLVLAGGTLSWPWSGVGVSCPGLGRGYLVLVLARGWEWGQGRRVTLSWSWLEVGVGGTLSWS